MPLNVHTNLSTNLHYHITPEKERSYNLLALNKVDKSEGTQNLSLMDDSNITMDLINHDFFLETISSVS